MTSETNLLFSYGVKSNITLQIEIFVRSKNMVGQKWLQKNELLLLTLFCGLLSIPTTLGTNENDGQRARRSTANFGKRITSSLVAELGKRPKDMYAFGIGNIFKLYSVYTIDFVFLIYHSGAVLTQFEKFNIPYNKL